MSASERPPDAPIVVTGVGVISPLGSDAGSFWSAALAGTVATAELRHFDTAQLGSRLGGELTALRDASAVAAPPLAVRLATAAAMMAVADADVASAGAAADRIGVCVGTVMGTRPALEPWLRRRAEEPVSRQPAWTSAATLSRAPAAQLGFDGPTWTIATACAAGNSAIATAAEALRDDRADVMVAGGADELSQAMLMMFDSFRALAPDAVRPFDRDRRGLLLAEAAAALVLEREADARARGAPIYGRVLGWANVADAHHMTAPHPEGSGAIRAMRGALAHAGLSATDVDHVSAHGTGTPSNDVVEARALRQVLGGHADHVPVSALKSMLGHAQGAASAIEAIGCLMTLRDGVAPPTANLRALDPSCDIDVVGPSPRRGAFDVALSNAFGFGGNIECVVFGAA